MTELDEDTDQKWGWSDSRCTAGAFLGRVDDLGLCEACRPKLEPGTLWVLIRQRDWDYSAFAFGLSDQSREKLYRQVIAQYGQNLELMASPAGTRKQRPAQRRERNGRGKPPGAQNRGQST